METVDFFNNGLLLFVLISFLAIQPSLRPNQVITVPGKFWCIMIGLYAVTCIANCPVPWYATGADRTTYALSVINASSPFAVLNYQGRETLFHAYVFFSGKIMGYQTWFYLTALIYVGNYFWAACRMSKDYTFVLFLMMLCCFQFYGYGVNTLRAGLAGSFVILSLTFVNRPIIMGFLLMAGYLIHGSMIIPIAAITCALAYRRTKVYLAIWVAMIVVSYYIGSSIETMVQGLTDDQRTGYLAVDATQTHYKVGFRWDFLLYSSLPVMIGYYYIFMRNFKSQFYQFVYNMYLAANSFWILVIRANYTDRFAYLSWFLFPILLFYPLITQQLFKNVWDQRRDIFVVMCIEFGFTYFMYWAYK